MSKILTFRVFGYYGDLSQEVAVRISPAGKDENGNVYEVFVGELHVGWIRKKYATFEREWKGHRAVLKRWRSLRWFAEATPTVEHKTKTRLYRFPKTTISQAANELAEEYVRFIKPSEVI